MDEEDLVAAIAAAPDDDEPRLVYADWLAQHGDPRGELMALQVTFDRAEVADLPLPQRGRIRSRIAKLLEAHEAEWTRPLREVAPARYELRRGMVEVVADFQGKDLGAIADELFAQAPLLRRAHVKAPAVHSMIMNDASASFAELVFEQPSLDAQHLTRLAERLADGALASVDFEAPYVADEDAFAKWPVDVAHFGVTMKRRTIAQLGAQFLAAFAQAPERTALRSLRLEGVNLDAIDPPKDLHALESLAITNCRVGRLPNNLAKLLRALPNLTSLAIAKDGISIADAETIVASCPKLRRLALRDVGLSARAVEVVLAFAPELRRLDVTGNPLEEGAARVLMRTELPHLVSLAFPTQLLDEPLRKALAKQFRGILVR